MPFFFACILRTCAIHFACVEKYSSHESYTVIEDERGAIVSSSFNPNRLSTRSFATLEESYFLKVNTLILVLSPTLVSQTNSDYRMNRASFTLLIQLPTRSMLYK